MKKINFFATSLVLLFMIGMYFFIKKMESNEYKNEVESKREFKSKIVKIFRDRENHGAGTLLLKNNMKYQVNENIYYKLKIGDSLVKEKLNLKVIRQDTIMNFDLTYKDEY